MNDDQIKHMVSRFLQWKLPSDFNPDDGVTFDPIRSRNTVHEKDVRLTGEMPVGTNLLTGTQAEQMVRHILRDLPAEPQMGNDPKPVADYDESAMAAWDFIAPKLRSLKEDKGLAGVWSNGFRSGWTANERASEAALATAEQRGRDAERELCAKLVDSHKPDASFDDSSAGYVERDALLKNLAAAIRKGD